jgi:hypothetical protein
VAGLAYKATERRTHETRQGSRKSDRWLSINLNSRPVFIAEKPVPLRPDLRVDTVRSAQTGCVVRAVVTNHDTRATPVRSGSRVPCPTRAVPKANGYSLTQAVRATSVAAERQPEFACDLSKAGLSNTVLFSMTVNPSQTYVELGTDDNTVYELVVKS